MEPPKIHIYTPARIVTLALVALAVLALGCVRFAPDDHVAVPSGAHAGDLAHEPCEYSTESGSYAADCGTLVVRESRADPESPLIALPVTRIRATSDDPKEPIFRLEGGPGLTNMDFANASRFVDDHDVVLVGYRGVDGEVASASLRAFGSQDSTGFGAGSLRPRAGLATSRFPGDVVAVVCVTNVTFATSRARATRGSTAPTFDS